MLECPHAIRGGPAFPVSQQSYRGACIKSKHTAIIIAPRFAVRFRFPLAHKDFAMCAAIAKFSETCKVN